MPGDSAPPRHRDSPPEPWRSFLVSLDQLLTDRVDLHCVGGFVVTLQFGLSRNTRLERMWPEFKLDHLRLFALEAHDLALTKLERNSEKDRQDIEDLARAGKLDPETLRARYVREFRPNLLAHAERQDLTMDLWIESIQEILAGLRQPPENG